MKFDILTLFPEMFEAVLDKSIIGRAKEKGLLELNYIQIRDFAFNKHRSVDDYPYGGGQGMVMQAEPIFKTYESVTEDLNYNLILFICLRREELSDNPQQNVWQKSMTMLLYFADIMKGWTRDLLMR